MMKYVPSLDKQFKPMIYVLDEFRKQVASVEQQTELVLCLERNQGYNYIHKINVFKDGTGFDDYNYQVIERLLKSLLWVVGAYKIYIAGSEYVYVRIASDYRLEGNRAFDFEFMSNVYEAPFEVLFVSYHDIPTLNEEVVEIKGELNGYRIGFDAGGSDRKVSAVIDGKTIFSDETVWNPKITSDPEYHYQGILDSMRRAAEHLDGRVDAIGVSSAGIYVNNKTMVASLFLKVAKEDFDRKAKNIYIDVAKEFGDVPLVVANDGDVAALAGASDLNSDCVLGIAMGTSEAAGYVDEHRNLKGWLNELAFVPVDFSKAAMVDEWSGDYGCGVKYFSQDSVIKLAGFAGITFEENMTPAQKLKYIQKLNDSGHEKANEIFEDIGLYLAYSLAYYAEFYPLKHILLLGRVLSGKGGNTILEVSKRVLDAEFSHLSSIQIHLPDESKRRVGQSEAAASLPRID